MPMVPGKGFVYTQPHYDTIVLAAGAAGAVNGQFFAVPFGGGLVGGASIDSTLLAVALAIGIIKRRPSTTR